MKLEFIGLGNQSEYGKEDSEEAYVPRRVAALTDAEVQRCCRELSFLKVITIT